jgi:hypothetical protein
MNEVDASSNARLRPLEFPLAPFLLGPREH